MLVLDAGEAPGGLSRAMEFAPGFRAAPLGLDAGWLPPAVARGIGMGIGDLADTEPAVGITIATPDNELLSLPCDPRKAAERIATLSTSDAERWPKFVGRLRSLAAFLEALYQLPPQQALEKALKVSDHLPVWAEFSTYEATMPGRVAGLPETMIRAQ